MKASMLPRMRVSTTIHLCMIFISGWLIGSIVLFLAYTQIPSSPMERKFLRIGGEIRLRPSLHSEALGVSYKPGIMLLWPYPIANFSVLHYRVLESMLREYSHTKVRVFNPTFDEQSPLFQTKTLFSKYHFLKYKKLFYNIELKTLSSLQFSYGKNYLDTLKDDLPLKFHSKMFIMLTILFQLGGVISDFSIYFRNKLNPLTFQHAWHFDTFCQSDKCHTNVLLVFSYQRPLLKCVLELYNQKKFRSCIHDDKIYEGRECIEQSFAQCAKKRNIHNDFDTYPSAIVSLSTQGTGTSRPSEEYSGLAYSIGSWILSNEHIPVNISNTSLNAEIPFVDDTHSALPACSHYQKITENAVNSRIFSESCAPSIVLPQFMRTYSSYFQHLLLAHPQVLPPLDSCYNSQNELKLNLRHICHPFVESHESFLSIASSFSLAMDYEAPYLIKQDNPNAKVISNYRFY